jgi:hypothetical protein
MVLGSATTPPILRKNPRSGSIAGSLPDFTRGGKK